MDNEEARIIEPCGLNLLLGALRKFQSVGSFERRELGSLRESF